MIRGWLNVVRGGKNLGGWGTKGTDDEGKFNTGVLRHPPTFNGLPRDCSTFIINGREVMFLKIYRRCIDSRRVLHPE